MPTLQPPLIHSSWDWLELLHVVDSLNRISLHEPTRESAAALLSDDPAQFRDPHLQVRAATPEGLLGIHREFDGAAADWDDQHTEDDFDRLTAHIDARAPRPVVPLAALLAESKTEDPDDLVAQLADDRYLLLGHIDIDEANRRLADSECQVARRDDGTPSLEHQFVTIHRHHQECDPADPDDDCDDFLNPWPAQENTPSAVAVTLVDWDWP